MTINGWTIYAHPLFLDQLERLVQAVERDQKNDPKNYTKKPNAKLLKSVSTIALERIPQDPTDKRYRLGDTLGESHKHWFREKFGAGRFRLFFRYDSKSKVIIYAWINDEKTLRTYGAKSDAYAVFSAMLTDGNPPDNWEALLASCKDPEIVKRTEEMLAKQT
ncbi:type II toxin-antitoxin system YhaV family toxin [Bradyrhizobium sp.]|uniref:type II toxin-antitoxin system YhaV family toxin n=1 Tax=Bradyrhizobium sp. TaxID=376 RepID=UPI003C78F477